MRPSSLVMLILYPCRPWGSRLWLR